MPEREYKLFLPGCPIQIEWDCVRDGRWEIGVQNTAWFTVTEIVLNNSEVVSCRIEAGAHTVLTLAKAAESDFWIDRVTSEDGVVWNRTATPVPIIPPKPLGEVGAAFEAAWSTTPKYCPEQTETYWRCGCGAVNDNGRTGCAGCGLSRDWVLAHRDEEYCLRQAEQDAAAAELNRRMEEARRKQAEQKKQKNRMILRIALSGVAALVILVVGFVFWFLPARHYRKAQGYMSVDNYFAAYTEFGKAKSYRDAREQRAQIQKDLSRETKVSLGNRLVLFNNRLGKVEPFGYGMDGALFTTKWNSIRAVSAGESHSLGLHFSGTVMAAGDDSTGACKVDGWRDIVAIAAGNGFSVGLKNDGTVVAVGSNKYGQLNVTEWKNVVQIAAGKDFTLGLTADGKVLATGNNANGQCRVSDWSDIDFICAGQTHTLGVKTDGTVVGAGTDTKGECQVSEWENVVAVTAGAHFSVGLKSDGTLVSVGDNAAGQLPTDIQNAVAVISGTNCTAVIMQDGHPAYFGPHEWGVEQMESWNLPK